MHPENQSNDLPNVLFSLKGLVNHGSDFIHKMKRNVKNLKWQTYRNPHEPKVIKGIRLHVLNMARSQGGIKRTYINKTRSKGKFYETHRSPLQVKSRNLGVIKHQSEKIRAVYAKLLIINM